MLVLNVFSRECYILNGLLRFCKQLATWLGIHINYYSSFYHLTTLVDLTLQQRCIFYILGGGYLLSCYGRLGVFYYLLDYVIRAILQYI